MTDKSLVEKVVKQIEEDLVSKKTENEKKLEKLKEEKVYAQIINDINVGETYKNLCRSLDEIEKDIVCINDENKKINNTIRYFELNEDLIIKQFRK